MEPFNDWRFWLFVLAIFNSGIAILSAMFQKYSHDKIVGNDLKHLSSDVHELKEEQKCIKNKVIALSEDLSNLKGKLE